ncbi:ribosome silencing factor [bacterium]|nr:ribosome silencing factor [bacterium]
MSLERVKRLFKLLSEANGEEISILDISELSNFTDYFIIVSALSRSHLKQLMEEVPYNFKKDDGEYPNNVEGNPESGWIVLDYSDIIIHIFSKEKREYYNLEHIWGQGKRIELEN